MQDSKAPPDNRQDRTCRATKMILFSRKGGEKKLLLFCFTQNTATNTVRYMLSHILVYLHTLSFCVDRYVCVIESQTVQKMPWRL